MLKKKLRNWLVFILGLFLVFGLSRNIIRLMKSGQRLEEKKEEVRDLRAEQERLALEWERSQTETYVEEVARDRLNMAQEGEMVAVLPYGLEQVLGDKSWQIEEEKPNWRLWWEVFFD